MAEAPDWRDALPVLRGRHAQLREPVLADAPALFREICAPEVCEFVPPPPATIEGVERMIESGIEWRRAGRGFCFAIVPRPTAEPAGIIQFLASRDHSRAVPPDAPWEWGFALGSRYWGTGLFGEAAALALEFAFQCVGLRAVEAWVLQENRRGNAALARLGAKAELKPRTIAPDGRVGDFVKWTIWRQPRTPTPSRSRVGLRS